MRRLGALVLTVALLGGCSAVITDPNAGSIRDIAVGVDDDGVPTLEYPEGLEYSRVETRVELQGPGDRLEPGDRLLLDMYSISLDTGAVLTDTFTGLPRGDLILIPELVGKELYNALVGERVGARILHISPPVPGFEGQGAIALVVDVLPAKATGEMLPRRDDVPLVLLAADGKPTVVIGEEATPPLGLVIALLIQGLGEQIRDGSSIEVNFMGVSFDTGEVLYSSWDEGPMSKQIGIGELPLGWEQGLLGIAEGSQVLLITPPELGYPDDGTVVWVIDILAVWNPD